MTLIHLIYLISTYASEKSGGGKGKAKGVASKMVAETWVTHPPVGVGVLDDPWVAILYGAIWVCKGWYKVRRWVG